MLCFFPRFFFLKRFNEFTFLFFACFYICWRKNMNCCSNTVSCCIVNHFAHGFFSDEDLKFFCSPQVQICTREIPKEFVRNFLFFSRNVGVFFAFFCIAYFEVPSLLPPPCLLSNGKPDGWLNPPPLPGVGPPLSPLPKGAIFESLWWVRPIPLPPRCGQVDPMGGWER